MDVPSCYPRRCGLYFILFVGALLTIGLSGCFQSYGRFSRDAQVNRAFRSGSVPPELNYFYAGRENMPFAIMGIDPDYTNPSTLWISFEPEPEQLRKMSSNIYGKNQYNPYGFTILAPGGAIVGIWFSSLHFPSVKVDPQKRTVEVHYKNPERFQEH